MRSPCTSRILLCANPPSKASRTRAGSTPALRARVSASATAWMGQRHHDLVGGLGHLAGARRPDVGGGLAELVKHGLGARDGLLTAAGHDRKLPHQSRPARHRTPGHRRPPRRARPGPRARRAWWRGAIVDMSTKSIPSRTPARTPSSARTTACTSGESGSIVTTMSERSATSRGEPATSAPAAASFVGRLGGYGCGRRLGSQRGRVAPPWACP